MTKLRERHWATRKTSTRSAERIASLFEVTLSANPCPTNCSNAEDAAYLLNRTEAFMTMYMGQMIRYMSAQPSDFMPASRKWNQAKEALAAGKIDEVRDLCRETICLASGQTEQSLPPGQGDILD